MVDRAKVIFRKFLRTRESYLRGRLQLPSASGREGLPTIYFLTPDFDRPAGGILVIYRHVDILNSAGLPASVLHQRKGFRCSWFENDTRVTSVGETTIGRNDLLVVPEPDVDLLQRLPAGIGYVVFNQNAHLTWQRDADRAAVTYAGENGLRGVVTVSRHNREMLQYAFPGCPVHRVHLGLDPKVFHPGAGPRPRRIAYMPRRGRDDARQVLAMLAGRGVLKGWEVVALDGLAHHEVAEELRRTRIFLAFTSQEGFGLPAAEAMACGNYVVGNHGFAGREFFRPEFCTAVDTGDVLAFAQAVEAVVGNEAGHPGWCAERGRQASDFILKEYTQTREVREVARLYASLSGAAAMPAEAAE